nr:ABC transporter substrate-binding protein [Pseudonocardia kunmingensis]
MLAERWEFRAPNTWRFFLRHGVRFHDGQPFNAQAVKAGLFDRVAQRKNGSTIKAGPDSAVVVDEYTIDFTPTVPNLRVPEQIGHPSNVVYAPGSIAGVKPMGTGPFTFLEYAEGAHRRGPQRRLLGREGQGRADQLPVLPGQQRAQACPRGR